jgi:hypothetical protein
MTLGLPSFFDYKRPVKIIPHQLIAPALVV